MTESRRSRAAVVGGVAWLVLIEYRRYVFNMVSAAITMTLMFGVLLGGMQGLAAVEGITLGTSLESAVVGLLVWTLALLSYQSWSYGIVREAQTGTLEQLYLTPWGFHWVALGRLLGDLILPLMFAVLSLVVGFLFTRRPLHIDVFTLIPICLATILQAWGIGLILGGLALIFKRVEASFQIVQFVFIGLIGLAGFGRLPAVFALPLVLSARVAQRSLVGGISLWQQPEAPWLAAVTALWLVIGALVYRRLERIAVTQGKLGQY
ncbi:MAG: ABC transporter permease [bacterium]|nr:ABC transporter permease [bacterium]